MPKIRFFTDVEEFKENEIVDLEWDNAMKHVMRSEAEFLPREIETASIENPGDNLGSQVKRKRVRKFI